MPKMSDIVSLIHPLPWTDIACQVELPQCQISSAQPRLQVIVRIGLSQHAVAWVVGQTRGALSAYLMQFGPLYIPCPFFVRFYIACCILRKLKIMRKTVNLTYQMGNNRINMLPILEGGNSLANDARKKKERTELLSNAECLFKKRGRGRFRRDI